MIYIFQNNSVQENVSVHKISSAQNDPIQPLCNVANCVRFYKGISALPFACFR